MDRRKSGGAERATEGALGLVFLCEEAGDVGSSLLLSLALSPKWSLTATTNC